MGTGYLFSTQLRPSDGRSSNWNQRLAACSSHTRGQHRHAVGVGNCLPGRHKQGQQHSPCHQSSRPAAHGTSCTCVLWHTIPRTCSEAADTILKGFGAAFRRHLGQSRKAHPGDMDALGPKMQCTRRQPKHAQAFCVCCHCWADNDNPRVGSKIHGKKTGCSPGNKSKTAWSQQSYLQCTQIARTK